MAAVWLVFSATLGCGAGGATQPPPAEPEAPHAVLADEDSYQPTYGVPELQEALIAERRIEAAAARRIGELSARIEQADAAVPPTAPVRADATDDQLREATADLAVRRRFIASLEACQQAGRLCPPRLDEPAWSYDPDADVPADPPMTAVLRFDLSSWRALAGELFGRACACRTAACLDSVGAAIDRLEPRPMPDTRGDEAASRSITRARECLFRLHGKSVMRPSADAEPQQ